MNNVYVIKKDQRKEKFDSQKIKDAVSKSANRVNINLTDEEYNKVIEFVERFIRDNKITEVLVQDLHPMENVLYIGLM